MAIEAGSTLTRTRRLRQATAVRGFLTFVWTHPVWGVFLLALTIRVVVAVGIAIVHPHNFATDGLEYSQLAADKATGHTGYWGTWEHYLYPHTATLLLPVTWLYELFGVHQIVGQLYVALLGAGTAAVVTRLAMEVLPRRYSLAAGLIVAFLPTQIVWSAAILKDTSVWILITGLALTVAVAGRSRGRKLILLGLVAAVLLVLLGYLRGYTLIIASWALVLAVLVGPRTQRIPQIVGAVALALLIPWLVFQMGPAGVAYIHNSQAPSQLRSAWTVGAGSAISAAKKKPQPTSKGTSGIQSDQSEVGADVSYLPQGVLVVLFQPYPWQSSGSAYLKIARVDAVIWYPLLLLACFGLLAVRPRHLRVMAFPLVAGGAILVSYALVEGNVGTAFRHRGEFEWVVALLAGFGLWRLATWWRSRERGSEQRGTRGSGGRDTESNGDRRPRDSSQLEPDAPDRPGSMLPDHVF